MKKIFTSVLLVAFAISGFAADITIDAGKITNLNWTKDNVYRINGWAYVDSLDVLNIEAGTVIKGFPGEAESSSALIISRGGKIMANGTAAEPIIFTALADDLSGSVPVQAAGLWGGIIMLGYGQTNNGSQKSIEGISADLDFGFFGGTPEQEVENQSAGEMSYVSIRHGGTNIGEGNEINGLTMGACGTETIISFVEVIANQDDGIELFGGAPKVDHFIVSYCGDDSYDLDHGVRSFGQFLYALQDTASWGECFGEHDGGSGSGETSPFIAHTVFSNATFIGNTDAGDASKKAFVLRDNWSGEYHNSIFSDAPVGIYLEWRGDKTSSYDRLMANEIAFKNNIFSGISDNTAEGICIIVDDQSNNVPIDTATFKKSQFVEKFNSWNNDLSTNPGITISNPVPAGNVNGAVFAGLDSWFEQVDYKGAFDPEITCGHWGGGWSLTFADVDYVTDAAECEPIDGLSGELADAKVSVYPNPASIQANFTFDNAANEIFNLNLFDTSGRNVITASTVSSAIELDITAIPAGLYTYSLRNADHSINSVGQLIVK